MILSLPMSQFQSQQLMTSQIRSPECPRQWHSGPRCYYRQPRHPLVAYHNAIYQKLRTHENGQLMKNFH